MEGLRRLADADGESVAYHARRAIAAYLKKHDKPTLEVR
jgi:predicted transcriptional regulator